MTRFNFFVEFSRHIKGSFFVLIAPEYRGVGGNVRQQISFVVVYDVLEGFFHHGRKRAVIIAPFKPFPELFQDFVQQNFQAVFYPPSGLNSRAVHQHEFFDFFGIFCRNVNRNPPAERMTDKRRFFDIKFIHKFQNAVRIVFHGQRIIGMWRFPKTVKINERGSYGQVFRDK